MDDTYLTISRTSEGIYKEKMSKFLAFAIPCSIRISSVVPRYAHPTLQPEKVS